MSPPCKATVPSVPTVPNSLEPLCCNGFRGHTSSKPGAFPLCPLCPSLGEVAALSIEESLCAAAVFALLPSSISWGHGTRSHLANTCTWSAANGANRGHRNGQSRHFCARVRLTAAPPYRAGFIQNVGTARPQLRHCPGPSASRLGRIATASA